MVWFLGFQPGFPYLGSLPNNYTRHGALNRACTFRQVLSDRRAADRCLSAGNAGWLAVVGHTSLSLFDPARDEPILLRRETACALYRRRREYAEDYSWGMYTTVQDGGRHGFRQSGITTVAHWICLRYVLLTCWWVMCQRSGAGDHARSVNG